MPPRKRISNIARLLPRKRASAPDRTEDTVPPVHRDCASLPAGIGGLDEALGGELGKFEEGQTSGHAKVQSDVMGYPEPHDLRVHRFAQRYESNQLPSYRDYPPVEEEGSPYPSTSLEETHPTTSPAHSSELPEERVQSCSPHCDLSSLHYEISLLRENHEILSETTGKTLRLAEALEARIESLQRGARPSERLFWMLLDGVAAVVLFLIGVVMKPWVMARKWFVAERVRKRKSWRLSVGDFEDDPFLGDVAKRLSFSAVDD